ncbi:ANR family transcriptional regulator [Serratia fonticola]|uniref:ANR family transcriptional regulator n=1 Tax=Serratia fonticola TaxID=47917 RepID=UPI00301D8920
MKTLSQYKRIASVAVQFELVGDYAQAAASWRKAALCAIREINQAWCENRAHHCDMRLFRQSVRSSRCGGAA